MNNHLPILRTDHLVRSVDHQLIVNDISIEVPQGEILAIVGPSGAGKSSFLRLINRLDEPTSGTVFLKGQDYHAIPPRELRRRVAMMMQFPYFFTGTIADNIQFGPAQRGEQIPAETVDRLLEEVGLPGYASRTPDHLSGGEAQRVSLARTLANSPEVLLLDEPTSALDEASKGGVEALIRRVIAEKNLTCLIVTHDLDEAARFAHRVMVLVKGQVDRIGPVEEVLRAQPNLP